MTKAIFFDIDGTLVSFETHGIPASTVEAIAAAHARGIKMFIATGRAPGFINNLGRADRRLCHDERRLLLRGQRGHP